MKHFLLLSLALVSSSVFSQDRTQKSADFYASQQELCINSEVADCIPIYGQSLLGKPYVAKTLEINEREALVINLEELDCTTFVESVLAMAMTAHDPSDRSFEAFKANVQKLRYRQGVIESYASRLHYFSDWLYENEQNKAIRNITQELGGVLYDKKINFMSTHPNAYKQLAKQSELDKIIEVENQINEREKYYIPKHKIKEIENQLNDGDIVAITTTVEGLDVAHEGIILKRDRRAYLLHASSELKKVVISNEPLVDYIEKHRNQTGIMVARAN